MEEGLELCKTQPVEDSLQAEVESWFPQTPAKPKAPQKGVKRPFAEEEESSDDSDESLRPSPMDELDLARYFDHFGIAEKERVSLCRGFATYISSKIKSSKR